MDIRSRIAVAANQQYLEAVRKHQTAVELALLEILVLLDTGRRRDEMEEFRWEQYVELRHAEAVWATRTAPEPQPVTTDPLGELKHEAVRKNGQRVKVMYEGQPMEGLIANHTLTGGGNEPWAVQYEVECEGKAPAWYRSNKIEFL